ncbi:MAG: type 4a pilus biogenesis protein PilO [Nitrospirae bacterium]|nr:type 4a pilus biogenesis protein PilO [Nitrospirota bacterium]
MIAIPDINKLHPGLKTLIAFLPAILIAIPFYLLIVQPKNEEIKKLRAEIVKLDEETATVQKKLKQLPGLEKKLELANQEYEMIRRFLPEMKEITPLFKKLLETAKESNLKITRWTPRDVVTHPSNIVVEIPVDIEIMGAYHDMGEFLSRITAFDRILTIPKMRLESPVTSGGAVNLKITLTASTYSAVPKEGGPAK